MSADEARALRRAAALQRLIRMNDDVIRRRATDLGASTSHLFVIDALTGIDLRADIERHYRGKGFEIVSTYGGIGLKVSF